ncbi:hypothetical protein HS7_15510 [Sulfolobales archaeon HS-7]|nr:hypothetical protein HS7_15510 [Sulfolobales archaeon HS-7]
MSKGSLFYRFVRHFPSLTRLVLLNSPPSLKLKAIEMISRGIIDDNTTLNLSHSFKEKNVGGIPFIELDSDEGIYTGNSIVIKTGTSLSEIGINSGDSDEAAKQFWNWLNSVALPAAFAIEEGNSTVDNALNVKLFRTLVHEHCHWRILNGSSLSAIISAVSWRVELDQLLIGEEIYKRTGIPRNLMNDGSKWIKDNLSSVEQSLESLTTDDRIIDTINDLILHHFALTVFYPAVISPLVETLTWALIEREYVENKEKYLKMYFSSLPENSFEIAKDILDLSLRYLNSGVSRVKLINAANTALDFPIEEAYNSGLIGGMSAFDISEQLANIHNFLFDRFKRTLEGERVRTEIPENKSFRRIISYASKKGKAFDTSFLLRSPDASILGLSEVMKTYLTPNSKNPTVIAYVSTASGERIETVYSELTPLKRRTRESTNNPLVKSHQTGVPIMRPGDLAGDSIQLIVTVLAILMSLLFKEQVAKRLVSIGKRISYFDPQGYEVYKEIVGRILSGDPYFPTWDILGNKFELYNSLLRREETSYYKFLELWVRIIAELGSSSEYLITEGNV